MARTYPNWHGIERMTQLFGMRTPPAKYRNCCICGGEATRVATVQISWFRSEDELFPLCGPTNACRDALKKREGIVERFSASPSAISTPKE